MGQRFADALREKAQERVSVRVVYDWFGSLGKASAGFWRHLREGGVDVRCYNPPRLDQPLGWIGRDHRKCLVVDGQVAFVTGLCVGRMWEGAPARGLAGWRDTGVEVRGPAVAEVARAFADTWEATGAPLAPDEVAPPELPAEGDLDLRVVATTPGTAGLYRLDPLVASLARRTLWLTDAYFAGTSSYVQSLRAAAQDGVDVRLLVPGAGSDVPMMQAVSRAGYRALLEAGVRVYEWNGPMLHAKTAVADARWARVGSTNLNLASWMGNRELDVVVENEVFGRRMEEMFQDDIGNATEIVLRRGVSGAPRGGRSGAPGPGRRGERDARRGWRAARRQRPRVRSDREAGPRAGGALAHGRGRAPTHRSGRPRVRVAAPSGLAARRVQPVARARATRPCRTAKGSDASAASSRLRRVRERPPAPASRPEPPSLVRWCGDRSVNRDGRGFESSDGGELHERVDGHGEPNLESCPSP